MLKVGAAWALINPPLNLPHGGWGAQSHVYAEGIAFEFRATALVLSGAEQTAVLISLDLCRLLPEQVEDIRGHAAEALGLPPACVSVAVTHTHAGPVTAHDYYPEGRDVRQAYMRFVREQAVSAVMQAWRSKEPATLSASYGSCTVGKNRRQLLDGGRMVAGYNEGGIADPTVGVLGFQRDDGTTIAGIVQYACHPTTLGYTNRLFSPDYPGVTRQVVERLVGGNCLFLQGAAGDVGPGPEGFLHHVEAMERIGMILGCEAAKALLEAKAAAIAHRFEAVVESGADLGVWRSELSTAAASELPLRVCSETVRLPLGEQLPIAEAERLFEECRRALEELLEGGADEEKLRSATYKAKRASLALGRSRQFYGKQENEVEVHAIRIGDAVIVGVPLEPFSSIGITIRERSPFPCTLFGGYANGWFGYLPTETDYAAGGYEVETTPFSSEAAERLITEVGRILQSLWRLDAQG